MYFRSLVDTSTLTPSTTTKFGDRFIPLPIIPNDGEGNDGDDGDDAPGDAPAGDPEIDQEDEGDGEDGDEDDDDGSDSVVIDDSEDNGAGDDGAGDDAPGDIPGGAEVDQNERHDEMSESREIFNLDSDSGKFNFGEMCGKRLFILGINIFYAFDFADTTDDSESIITDTSDDNDTSMFSLW